MNLKSISKIVKLSTLCLILSTSIASAQTRVKIVADEAEGRLNENGEQIATYKGNAILTHNDTKIYADSAVLLQEKQIAEMFGNVRIVEGDSITVTAKKLKYDGTSRVANLRDDIVFKKLNVVTLYTDYLDYDRNKQLAYYYNGGRLVDSTNTLTSNKGYYNTFSNMASFKKNVVAKNPDYTLKSDTLQYNTQSSIVYFRDETEIIDKEGNIFKQQRGSYNTQLKQTVLTNGNIETKSYNLTGNSMFGNDLNQYYRANGDVEMVAKSDDVIIEGDIGEHWKNTGITKIYGHALMKKVTDGDTLYLAADTLISIDSEHEAKKRLLAYHNVKIFKTDLQGKADSLAYIMSDSIIHFYNDPILWNDGNQLSADSINLQMANNTIDHLNMSVNSFVISEDTIKNYNQIKGRKMVALFKEGKVNKVNVTGNGESLYFAIEEKDNSLMGMNKIICSNMVINFKENQVDNIIFYIQPEAELIPPHELDESDKKLSGFHWASESRPTKSDVVGPPPPEEAPEQ